MRKLYQVTIYSTPIKGENGICYNIYPQINVIKEHGTYFDREIKQPELILSMNVGFMNILPIMGKKPCKICTYTFTDKQTAMSLVDVLNGIKGENNND